MEKNKLYSILPYFDKYEQNRLRKYLLSPYFNKNETLVQLYDLLLKNANAAKPKELKKEVIWLKIMGNKGYDDVRFRKLNSELLKLVENYLAQQIYDENPLHKATYLIEAVGRKKMEKLYRSSMRTARRLSDQQDLRPANFFYYQYQIEKNYHQLTEKKFKRANRYNVEDIVNNLDRFYLAEKLRYHSTVVSQQDIVSHKYELLFIDEIINHIKIYKYDDVPPIAVYYQIYLTQEEEENEEHYFRLKDLLTKYGLQFPEDEAQFIYSAALNYCIRKINQNIPRFLREYFDVYEDSLKKEIIYVDGELPPWHFKNIIVAALRLGEYIWTENFIQNYKNKLPNALRDNAVTYNLAQLYFYQKRYKEVIQLLQQVEYEDVAYNLGSKAILMATYYETDEIEPLYSLFDSFRVYLNRHNKIPVIKRRNYLNLIKLLKKLVRIGSNDKKELQKLKEEVNTTKGIASEQWLKEKIAELE